MSQVKWIAVALFLLGFAHPAFWLGAVVAFEMARGGTDVVAIWAEERMGRFRGRD